MANISQDEVLDSDERASLQLSGLGENHITLNAYSEMQDIYDELLFQFPKLKQAGGFELLRVPEGGGKLLQVIASPESGYTVSYLRAIVHHAKIFIRPMQNNLDSDPEPSQVDCCVYVYTGYSKANFPYLDTQLSSPRTVLEMWGDGLHYIIA